MAGHVVLYGVKYLIANGLLLSHGLRITEDSEKIYLANYDTDHKFNSQDFWERTSWNPVNLHFLDYSTATLSIRNPDPNPLLSPKPTWQELQDAWKGWQLLHPDEYFPPGFSDLRHRELIENIRENLTDVRFDDIYTGSGLTHMTGLAHLLENSNLAGHRIPPIIMRDDKNKPRNFYTQVSMRGLLSKLAERENVVESAHNKVMIKVQEFKAIADDTSKTESERFDARTKERDLLKIENYKKELDKEIAAYDPDALPEDLKELRIVYAERLEAVATRKMKSIENAVTQHGIDLPPSCLDQNNAVLKVTEKQQKGKLELVVMEKETGRDVGFRKKKLGEIFELWKKRIEDVKVINSPDWTINGEAVKGGTAKITHPGLITIIAKQPKSGMTGTVAIEGLSASGTAVDTRFEVPRQQQGIAMHQVSVGIKDDNFVGTVKLELTARNICGPSDLTIEWERKKTPLGG